MTTGITGGLASNALTKFSCFCISGFLVSINAAVGGQRNWLCNDFIPKEGRKCKRVLMWSIFWSNSVNWSRSLTSTKWRIKTRIGYWDIAKTTSLTAMKTRRTSNHRIKINQMTLKSSREKCLRMQKSIKSNKSCNSMKIWRLESKMKLRDVNILITLLLKMKENINQEIQMSIMPKNSVV